jgi:hypothetical protein
MTERDNLPWVVGIVGVTSILFWLSGLVPGVPGWFSGLLLLAGFITVGITLLAAFLLWCSRTQTERKNMSPTRPQIARRQKVLEIVQISGEEGATARTISEMIGIHYTTANDDLHLLRNEGEVMIRDLEEKPRVWVTT